MDRNKRIGILVVIAFVLGTIFTVIATSQLEITQKVNARNQNEAALRSNSAAETSPAHGDENPRSSLAQEQQNLIAQLNGVFVQAAQKVKPSVVTVFSEKVVKIQRRDPFELFFGDEFYRQFFGRPRQRDDKEQEYVQKGMGSGVIVHSDGAILTNYHVIKDADDIRVKTADGEEYKAEIVGTDPKTDIAVVKIDASNLPAAPLGDSDKLEVGEWVLAIGNPFSEELRFTVTKGIVSATERKGLGLAEGQGYENFIQTDAAINPGNSGGALSNLYGEVIGINTAIVTPSGGFAGVGFAIPINMAKKVMDDLITKGKVVRGWLGVAIQPVDKDMARALGLKSDQGAIVIGVTKESPADKAGIQVSDVIIRFNGVQVKSGDHLTFLVADVAPGKTVEVVVNRNGTEKELAVKIGEQETGAREQIVSTPKVAEKLGIEVTNLTDELAHQYGYETGTGVLISRVNATSEAYRKNLRQGDLIKEINRTKVTSVAEFNDSMKNMKPGDVALFLVQRERNSFFVALEIPKE